MSLFERTRDHFVALVAALATFLSALATAYAQPLYQGADTGSHRLTILGITSQSFSGVALNDIGDVLGWSPAPDGLPRVMRWDGNRLVDLGPGMAGDIDNRRRMVGSHKDATAMHAALWDRRRLVLLEDQGDYSHASAISRAGHIAGYVNQHRPVATLWHGGTTTSLWQGYAFDVNSSGVAAGWQFSEGQADSFAVIGDGVHTTILGSASGISLANAINERNEVVGSDNNRAFLWRSGTAIELALPAGVWAASSAEDISELGTIVGSSVTNRAESRAIRWVDPAQAAVDLNTLLSPGDIAAGWILVQAARVNNRGAILGYAINPLRCPENNCNPYSFLLEPAD